jgi:membrane protease YdiL (CAAX protease family)
MPLPLRYFAAIIEIGFAAAGAVLLWRLVLSPAARARREPARLTPWVGPATNFAMFLFLVMSGSFIAVMAAGALSGPLGFRGDAATVLNGAAAQLGMLAGVDLFRRRTDRSLPMARVSSLLVDLPSGFATFLISLPLLLATAAAWTFLLETFGLPTGKQDLIGLFANADSPWQLAAMISLAVIIAPLTEELVFRAGLFRFLRTHLPRWIALLLPATIFASLHINWHTLQGLASLAPLVLLAVIFSLAYERTGRIGTCIVAHAFFNLNTILVIFSGLDL